MTTTTVILSIIISYIDEDEDDEYYHDYSKPIMSFHDMKVLYQHHRSIHDDET
jgi:hypothetical protein